MTGSVLVGSALADGSDIPSESGVLGGPALLTTPSGAAELPTLFALAVQEAVDIPKIPENNPSLSPASLRAYGEAMSGAAALVASEARSYGGDSSGESQKLAGRYFIQPASGINWGIAHDHNAIDIANTCGTTVVAAADGTVTETAADGGWHDGYGNYIFVEHPNGLKTKYAHLQRVMASVGDFVYQGKAIGTIGNSGNVSGVTGCHLHFEVYGAKNPFIKK